MGDTVLLNGASGAGKSHAAEQLKRIDNDVCVVEAGAIAVSLGAERSFSGRQRQLALQIRAAKKDRAPTIVVGHLIIEERAKYLLVPEDAVRIIAPHIFVTMTAPAHILLERTTTRSAQRSAGKTASELEKIQLLELAAAAKMAGQLGKPHIVLEQPSRNELMHVLEDLKRA